MSREDKNEKLISIEEFIARAKRFGVDFGNGDPKNRLRYYVKIGLLPHAQRKSFNGLPPNGAYSEEVLGILLEIDKKLKDGKSVQEIKREIRKEKEKKEEILKERFFNRPFISPLPAQTFQRKTWEGLPIYKPSPPPPEIQEEFQPTKRPKFNFKSATLLQIGLMVLVFGAITFFAVAKVGIKDIAPYFLAVVERAAKLVQLPPDFLPEEEREEILLSPLFEPYLTINAETAINAPLKVKEKITAPTFALIRDEFEGRMIAAVLTADREYNFPDLSGTVCLTAGNCVGLVGEVLTPGGTSNRLAKFISAQEIGDSSISDLYPGGIAITVDSAGNVGIGTLAPRAKLEVAGNLITTGKVGIDIENPLYSLHVGGRIQATGDICTDLVGGRCLSTLPISGGGGRGIGGFGTVGYLPIWSAGNTLGDSIVRQTGSVIDVAGDVKMLGFQLPTGTTTAGYVLTTDDDGIGTWQPIPPVIIPGEPGQTLRYDGTQWIGNYFLYNTGSAIGIGTTSTLAALTVAGDGYFSGPLTIATSALAQLILQYDADNYLRFEIDSATAKILSSKTMVIDSLTGEVRIGDNVTLFDASNATVTAATFLSAADDSTVRKSGELVFRASLPIFRFAIPAQTTSTSYTTTSKTFFPTDSLTLTAPTQLPGTSRVYAFLINFADDIATTSNSSWRIFQPNASTTYSAFSFPGQNLGSLEVGNPHMTATATLPDNDWRLDVSVPSTDKTIRIFNIFLLAFDQIN